MLLICFCCSSSVLDAGSVTQSVSGVDGAALSAYTPSLSIVDVGLAMS